MAQLQKGTTYITGDQVTAANLNALVDSGILTPDAVTDQTAKTVPLASDTILLHNAADTALRKTTMTQLFATPQPLGATTPSTIAGTTLSATGLLSFTGFGTNSLDASGTGAQTFRIRNSTAGTGNYSILQFGHSASVDTAGLVSTSTTYTASGAYPQNGTLLYGSQVGGLNLAATDGSGVIRFFAASGTATATINSAGAAITGTLSATGQITSTVASGTVTLESAAPYGTGYKAIRLGNTGSTLTVGVESSAGGSLLGSATGYAGVVSSNSTILQLGASNTIVATLSSGAAAITGTLSSSNTFSTFNNSTQELWRSVWDGGNTGGIAAPSGRGLYLTTSGTASTQGILINGSGSVGVGTASPAFKLDVMGQAKCSYLFAGYTGNDGRVYLRNTSEVTKIYMDGSGNGVVSIGNDTGTAQLTLSLDSATKPSTNTWTIASDSRVKNVTGEYKKGLAEILALRPITYRYNGKAGFEDTTTENVSIIAQEAINHFPECVGTYLAKLNPEDAEKTELLNWNGHAVTFALINAIKELTARLAALESK